MCAAINFAWVNRQLITHAVRETFADVFDQSWEALEMDLLYDVAHNIAKRETHDVYEVEDGYSLEGDGERVERDLYVHRKGATRAFPAGHPDVPTAYREVGQPVIIPGSMGAGSYVLKGRRGVPPPVVRLHRTRCWPPDESHAGQAGVRRRRGPDEPPRAEPDIREGRLRRDHR